MDHTTEHVTTRQELIKLLRGLCQSAYQLREVSAFHPGRLEFEVRSLLATCSSLHRRHLSSYPQLADELYMLAVQIEVASLLPRNDAILGDRFQKIEEAAAKIERLGAEI